MSPELQKTFKINWKNNKFQPWSNFNKRSMNCQILITNWHHFGNKSPPRRLQDASKTPQDAPVWCPRRPKSRPRGPRDAPKRPKSRPRVDQDAPRRRQDGTNTHQGASKRPSKRAQNVPGRTKTAPRRNKKPQDGPRRHQDALKTPPRRRQQAPKTKFFRYEPILAWDSLGFPAPFGIPWPQSSIGVLWNPT